VELAEGRRVEVEQQHLPQLLRDALGVALPDDPRGPVGEG
jgi:hypothetical protein